MWKFHLKTAFRSIQRKVLFSFLNITGLAIGIGIFFLALEFYSYETGFNRFHPELPRLYRLGIANAEGKSAGTFPAIAPLIEQHVPGVRKAIRFAAEFNDGAIVSWQPEVSKEERHSFREEQCIFVDPAFLDVFHFPLIAGANQLAETNTVVITASTATRLFGAGEAVGKTVRLHNQFGDLAVKVVGVTADPPDQSDIRFRYLFSIHILENPGYTESSNWAKLTTWGNDSYSTYLWLAPQADPNAVARAATRLWQQNDGDYARKKGSLFLQRLADIHLGAGWKDDNPHYSSYSLNWLIFSLGILILVIAWINYINFATADALTKVRDIGIHKIVGSQKWQIAGRYIAESILLNTISLALALVLAGVSQPLFNYITQRPLSINYINQPRIWLIISLILVTGCLLCGGYTGLLLSRLKPVKALHFNDPGKLGNTLLRKGLVVFQLSISCLFTGLTIVAFSQIRFMKSQSLGMDIQKLVVIKGPALRDSTFKAKAKVFRDEVSRLPFVENFTASGSVPGVGSGHNFGADGITGSAPQKDDDKIEYYISEVDEQYFQTYRIPLVAGTGFNEIDPTLAFKNNRLMVNETAAKLLGYQPSNAVGHIVNWDKAYTIIGVAKDYHHRSLKEKIEPIIYIAARNNGYYTIKTAPAMLAAKMQTVSRLYSNLFPGNSFSYTTLTDTFNNLYAGDQRTANIALSLSVLVILIAGLGLAGLAAFTARRRTKEMGIRKVLGATTQGLFFLLSKEYILLVCVAFFISTPVAWYAGDRWLQEFPFRIQPGWAMFTGAGVICLVIAMVTISFQAIRTAFVNPVQQLRTD